MVVLFQLAQAHNLLLNCLGEESAAATLADQGVNARVGTLRRRRHFALFYSNSLMRMFL
jgi:hypothetical protein